MQKKKGVTATLSSNVCVYVYVAVVCYGTLGVDPVRIEGEGGERRGMKRWVRQSISMYSTRVYHDMDKIRSVNERRMNETMHLMKIAAKKTSKTKNKR